MAGKPFEQHTCPRCGKHFEYPGPPVPGMNLPCRDCHYVMEDIDKAIKRLRAEQRKLEAEIKVLLSKRERA